MAYAQQVTTGRLAVDWSTYEAWLALLRSLRSGARAHGLVLETPEPERLPATMFERGALGSGSRVEAAWTLGKVMLYTAIGLAGAASLVSIAKDIKGRMTEA